jgi:hypothetical protein
MATNARFDWKSVAADEQIGVLAALVGKMNTDAAAVGDGLRPLFEHPCGETASRADAVGRLALTDPDVKSETNRMN